MKPKPKWWTTAKYLHDDGLTYEEIATQLGKSFQSVRYALCESQRRAHKKYQHRLKHLRKNRKKSLPSAEQLIRKNLREKARFLAKDSGRSLEECYKEMGCL